VKAENTGMCNKNFFFWGGGGGRKLSFNKIIFCKNRIHFKKCFGVLEGQTVWHLPGICLEE